MVLVNTGVLGPGQSEHYDVTLRGGVTYGISVLPDERGVDFDLYLYDENGNLVQKDDRLDGLAAILVTPKWSGPFRIFVRSNSGLSGYRIVMEAD